MLLYVPYVREPVNSYYILYMIYIIEDAHFGENFFYNTYSNLKPFGWVERSDITTEKVTFIKQGMA